MDTVDAADYLELATPAEPRVSPEGDRVAFVRRTPRQSPDRTDASDDANSDDANSDETAKESATGEAVEATIYVASLGGGEPRRFTATAGVDGCPRWSPSGDRVAFTSDRDDAPGSQLWVMPTDGGEARRVTCVPGGASALAWAPDGDRIAFLQSVTADERDADRDLGVEETYEPDEPDPRVIDRTVYRAAEEYFDGRRSHVYVARVGTGPRTGKTEGTETDGDGDPADGADGDGDDDTVLRITTGDVDHTAPAWGDDGALYYAAREPSDATADPDDAVEFAVKQAELETGTEQGGTDGSGEARAVSSVDTLTYDTGWEPMLDVAADGRVAYASTPTERGTLRQANVHVYDPATAEVSEPTASLDRTLSHDRTLQFGPHDESVYVTTPETGSIVVRRVPVAPAGSTETDDTPDSDPAVVVGDGMHCTDFHVTADLVGFVASEWDHPGDVFAATPRGAEETRLSMLNREYLADRAIVQPDAISFDAGDPTTLGSDGDRFDGEIQGWLFTPPGLGPDESAPLVVEVHGGPHVSWTPAGTMWHEFQTLAAAGFAVFACNPRGSTGYGEPFQAAIERDWGPQTAADVLAGVDAVQDRDAVDETETFVAGGSFGGYLTAWLLAHTDAFDAGVPQRGVYDLVSFYGSTDVAYKLVEWDWGETPWTDGEFLREHSPALHADEITVPTLILHAEDDYRVPVAGAELLYRGLRKHGTQTRLVRYPGEGHELSRSGEPGHVVDRIQRIRDWFQGYSTQFDEDDPISGN